MRTERQRSAGGVVVRGAGARAEVVLIAVGEPSRWQLPKGLIEQGESAEDAAVREVREEGGVDAEIIAPLEPIEYWYVGTERDGSRVRYHKEVRYFLMRHLGGSVRDHDREVQDARWVKLADAPAMLAFENERGVVARAAELLAAR